MEHTKMWEYVQSLKVWPAAECEEIDMSYLISLTLKSLYIQQSGNVQSFIRQEVHSSMKTVRVDIYKKLILASIEWQRLNVCVVNYVIPEIKTKYRQFGMNKTHNSRYLPRVP